MVVYSSDSFGEYQRLTELSSYGSPPPAFGSLVKHGVCPTLECLGGTVKSLCLNALAACQLPQCVGAPGKSVPFRRQECGHFSIDQSDSGRIGQIDDLATGLP